MFWSAIARLPIGMNGLALTLGVQHVTGRFDAAGTITAGFLVSAAISAPFVGRWIDQRGPHGIVPFLCFLYTASLLALFWIPAGAPVTAFAMLAALAGASIPPISTLSRAMWAKSEHSDAEKHAGSSLEGVLTEIAFMLGPVLVGLAVAWGDPRAGLLAAAAFCAVGTIGFLASGGTAQWGSVERGVRRDWFGPLGSPAFVLLMAISFTQCMGFGLNEMVFIAYAKATNTEPWVGALYFAACLTSALGTLWFGGLKSQRPRRHWLCAFALYTGATFAAMSLVEHYLALLTLAFFSGAFVGALIASVFTLSATTVATRYATEAGTWISSMLLTGIGAGFALAGLFLEHVSGWQALALVSGAPFLVVALLALKLK